MWKIKVCTNYSFCHLCSNLVHTSQYNLARCGPSTQVFTAELGKSFNSSGSACLPSLLTLNCFFTGAHDASISCQGAVVTHRLSGTPTGVTRTLCQRPEGCGPFLTNCSIPFLLNYHHWGRGLQYLVDWVQSIGKVLGPCYVHRWPPTHQSLLSPASRSTTEVHITSQRGAPNNFAFLCSWFSRGRGLCFKWGFQLQVC